jgi:hypothetical protein
MCVRFLTGKRVSHGQAIEDLGCYPDGVSMTRLQKILRGHGVRVGRCKHRQRDIRDALAAGKLVVIDDNDTYTEPHVVVIFAQLGKRFVVADPVRALPRVRRGRDVIKGAEALFTVMA